MQRVLVWAHDYSHPASRAMVGLQDSLLEALGVKERATFIGPRDFIDNNRDKLNKEKKTVITYIEALKLFDTGDVQAVLNWGHGMAKKYALHDTAKRYGVPHIYLEQGLLPGSLTASGSLSAESPLTNKAWNKYLRNGLRGAKYRATIRAMATYLKNANSIVSYKTHQELDLHGVYRKLRLDPSKKNILIIGQLDKDTNITKYSGHFKTNLSVLEWANPALGQHNLIYRHHPRDKDPISDEELQGKYPGLIIDHVTALPSLLMATDLLITRNSTVGIEALVRRIPVIALGKSIYSHRGITKDAFPTDGVVKCIKAAFKEARSTKAKFRTIAFFAWLMHDYLWWPKESEPVGGLHKFTSARVCNHLKLLCKYSSEAAAIEILGDLSKRQSAYPGQTCYIIGKGPSLDALEAADFKEPGPVIALNESVIKAEKLKLQNRDVYSLQQDGNPACMRRPERATLIVSKRNSIGFYPDYKPRIVFDRVKDLGLKDNAFTALSAIEIARAFGCSKVVFVSFDACYNGASGYPKSIGHLHYDETNRWRFKVHCDGIKLQLRGLSASFYSPEDKSSIDFKSAKYTILTPTGDRGALFRLCRKYILRQSVLPSQWLVIDDGIADMDWKDTYGADYHKRPRENSDPAHTLKRNVACALSKVKYDKILIFEDDDWYSRDYAEFMLPHLDRHDLVGLGHDIYYYLPLFKFIIHDNEEHAGFCRTGFSRKLLPYIHRQCNYLEETPYLDMQMWTQADAEERKKGITKKIFYPEDILQVGLKGMPGRMGLSSGHNQSQPYYEPDEEGRWLKSVIGKDDMRDYLEIIHGGERKKAELVKSETEKYSKLWGMDYRPSRTVMPFAKHIEERHEKQKETLKLLDMGCGDGSATYYLRKRSFNCVGADLTLDGLDHKNAEERKKGFLACSFWQIPFKDRHFDVTFSTDVLEHLPTEMVDLAIAEIFRVTKLATYHVIADFEDSWHGNTTHLTVRSVEWWRKRFKAVAHYGGHRSIEFYVFDREEFLAAKKASTCPKTP